MSSNFAYPEEWTPDAEEFLSDQEDDQLVDEDQPKITFPDTVILFGLPLVAGGEKHARLLKLVKKKFGKSSNAAGSSADDPGFTIDMPINPDTSKTDGVAWLKFPTRKDALKGKDRMNGQPLTGDSHICQAIMFDDYDVVMETDAEFNERKIMTQMAAGGDGSNNNTQQSSTTTALAARNTNNNITSNNPPPGVNVLPFVDDVRTWMLDDKCREQLLLRFQQETEIHWIDPLKTLDAYYCGEREKDKGKVWCDWKVDWSPHGSYLITCHRPGVCLWGGDAMEQKRKFAHPEVVEFCFSPDEKYFVTWNGNDKASGDSKAYKLWDVMSGRCLKELSCPSLAPGEDKHAFPHFVFSPDSKFLALMTEKEILFRKLPDCTAYTIPGGIPMRFENGISHFSFSPKHPIIAVWCHQSGESPSCLHVINIVTGERLQTRSRPQFNVHLTWAEPDGDYLCVELSRKGKINKDGIQLSNGKCRTLEILRMKERGIPVETIDVDCEGIKCIAWEPGLSRLALLVEHKESASKTVLLFYSLTSNSTKCEQIASFELQSNTYNSIFWSPEGQYLVVAAIGSGDLLWARLTNDSNNTLELLNKDDQVSLTNVQWDASGRYLLTSVFQSIMNTNSNDIKSGQDAGFRLWTFQGRPLHVEAIEKLYYASFRPTPPVKSQLTDEEINNLKKNLKQHSKKFDQIDDMARNKSRREEREQREIIISKFKKVCGQLDCNYHTYAEAIGWAENEIIFQDEHRFREIVDTVDELLTINEEVIGTD